MISLADAPADDRVVSPVPDYAGPPPEDEEPRRASKKVKKVKDKDKDFDRAAEIPSMSLVSRVRRVQDGCIEDYSGAKYVVWSIKGCDVLEDQFVNGWNALLNSIEYPIQILIRQHSPDYSDIRSSLLSSRPDGMREGWINEVGNSLLDYLKELENDESVVTRQWYVIGREDRSSELSSVIVQSGFDAVRLDDEQLGLLYQACVSGMRYRHVQDLYQMKEFPSELELNQRHAAVYEVKKWPRRVSPLFLEKLLKGVPEMDISLWIWPVSMRESHSRLQMQRSRFEGSKLASEQKGRLVPPEVLLAISDVSRIADGVERGVSRLFRRTMAVAVYGRDRDRLKDAEEKLKGYFRASLSSVEKLKFRQSQGFSCLMPVLRKSLGDMDLTDSDTMLRLFPFGPRDLDTREGTLLGRDMRSNTMVFVDPFSPDAMNGHMVVMARSGAGKSFFTKLRVEREALRNVPVYLIDPEGEYGVITRALGGEVFVPGAKGHGLNPFVVGRTDESDLAKRISSLCSLVGVMLEGTADQDMKAVIDRSLTMFYAHEWSANPTGRLGGGHAGVPRVPDDRGGQGFRRGPAGPPALPLRHRVLPVPDAGGCPGPVDQRGPGHEFQPQEPAVPAEARGHLHLRRGGVGAGGHQSPSPASRRRRVLDRAEHPLGRGGAAHHRQAGQEVLAGPDDHNPGRPGFPG